MPRSDAKAPKRYDSKAARDEYSVVEVKISWAFLSILIFFYSLPVDAWVRRLPWHPYHYWYRPGTMVLATLGMSVVGIILAGLGLRQGRHPKLARWAMLLNGAVFGLLLVAIAGLIVWWRYLR